MRLLPFLTLMRLPPLWLLATFAAALGTEHNPEAKESAGTPIQGLVGDKYVEVPGLLSPWASRGGTLRTMKAAKYSLCAAACDEKKECRAFQYDAKSTQCKLLRHRLQEYSTAFMYYAKKSWPDEGADPKASDKKTAAEKKKPAEKAKPEKAKKDKYQLMHEKLNAIATKKILKVDERVRRLEVQTTKLHARSYAVLEKARVSLMNKAKTAEIEREASHAKLDKAANKARIAKHRIQAEKRKKTHRPDEEGDGAALKQEQELWEDQTAIVETQVPAINEAAQRQLASLYGAYRLAVSETELRRSHLGPDLIRLAEAAAAIREAEAMEKEAQELPARSQEQRSQEWRNALSRATDAEQIAERELADATARKRNATLAIEKAQADGNAQLAALRARLKKEETEAQGLAAKAESSEARSKAQYEDAAAQRNASFAAAQVGSQVAKERAHEVAQNVLEVANEEVTKIESNATAQEAEAVSMTKETVAEVKSQSAEAIRRAKAAAEVQLKRKKKLQNMATTAMSTAGSSFVEGTKARTATRVADMVNGSIAGYESQLVSAKKEGGMIAEKVKNQKRAAAALAQKLARELKESRVTKAHAEAEVESAMKMSALSKSPAEKTEAMSAAATARRAVDRLERRIAELKQRVAANKQELKLLAAQITTNTSSTSAAQALKQTQELKSTEEESREAKDASSAARTAAAQEKGHARKVEMDLDAQLEALIGSEGADKALSQMRARLGIHMARSSWSLTEVPDFRARLQALNPVVPRFGSENGTSENGTDSSKLLAANYIKCQDWITAGLHAWDVKDVDAARTGKLIMAPPVVLQLSGGTNWTIQTFKKDKYLDVIGPPPFKANATKHILCLRPTNPSDAASQCCVERHMRYKAQSRVWLPPKALLYARLKEL